MYSVFSVVILLNLGMMIVIVEWMRFTTKSKFSWLCETCAGRMVVRKATQLCLMKRRFVIPQTTSPIYEINGMCIV